MTTKYYAVADIGGPVTVRIAAESASEAREWFLAQEANFGDDCRTDAEDDLGVCGDGMSYSEWSEVMERCGYEIADADMCGWTLWERQ